MFQPADVSMVDTASTVNKVELYRSILLSLFQSVLEALFHAVGMGYAMIMVFAHVTTVLQDLIVPKVCNQFFCSIRQLILECPGGAQSPCSGRGFCTFTGEDTQCNCFPGYIG